MGVYTYMVGGIVLYGDIIVLACIVVIGSIDNQSLVLIGKIKHAGSLNISFI
jgi:hypothetical protein